MSLLQLAAVLLFLLGLAHSVLGERYILIRLFRRSDLPKLFGGTAFTTRTLRFAWHITTVLWWGLAALLWRLSAGAGDTEELLHIVGLTCIACGLLPLVITRGRHLSWLVLFGAGGLILWQSGAA